MNDYIVNLNNVNFGYNEERLILNHISLSIPKGQIVAIMGGSGCGKTTLLRLICGQYSANSGTINVLGQDIGTLSKSEILKLRTQIGMLFQFGALFTDMTVNENVAFSLKEHTNLPQSIIDLIVAMKLKAVGLFGTGDLYPNQLSGGMSRRVALARSIALDPALMLYDEPFTGLDPISLNVTAMLIQKLNQTLGQTSILVTHDIQTTMAIADYIYFMGEGKVIAQGTPQEIANSDTPIVKQFLHGNVEGPINFEYKTDLSYHEIMGI